MTKTWLACVVVGCSSPASPPPPVPDDHQLHTTSTPEPGGTHLQIKGTGVAIKDLGLPANSFVPVVGTVDIDVELHVPADGDYRRATGEATARCASGCVIKYEPPAGVDPSIFPPPMPIDHFDAHAVFAKGTGDITSWTFVAKDIQVQVTGHLDLAQAFADSVATVCLRIGKTGEKLTPGSSVAATLAQIGIAIDANGMQNMKFRGPLAALELVDFGCDGQTRPDPPPPPTDSPDDLGGAITKLTNTSFDVDAGVIAKLLANPMLFAKSARFVPAVRDGKPHGYKIYALRPSSAVAKLGVANGDTILSIDKHALDSAENALALFTGLRDVHARQTVTVEIERAGKPLTLTYTIR
jgi:hypothetical protein